MRIALLTTQWPGVRTGGIGTYTQMCARALARAGVEVHVFTLTLPRGTSTDVPGVMVHEVKELVEQIIAGELSGDDAARAVGQGLAVQRLMQARAFAMAVLAVHERTPFDVIEAPEYEALGLGCMMLLGDRADRPAMVTHLHSGSAINRLANERDFTAEDAACELLESLVMLHADACCAPSEAVIRTTREVLPELPNATRIGLGIEIDRPVAETHDNTVLFVGRLEKLKGIEVLVPALRKFLAEQPEARAVLVGADTRRGDGTSMRAWAESVLDSDRVRFTGEVGPSEVGQYIARCRVLVVPSLYESFNLVAAQGMVQGKTVICSEDIGTAELLGPAGMTFRQGDAGDLAQKLARAWQQPNGMAMRARVESEFDAATIAQRRIAFYQLIKKSAMRLPAFEDLQQRVAVGDVMTPGKRLLRALADRPATEILLFGAGRHTARLLSEKSLWEKRGHRIVGIVDEHPRYAAGGTFLNVPVHSPAALVAQAPDAVVVLSSDTMEELFWQRTEALRAKGFDVLRLYA